MARRRSHTVTEAAPFQREGWSAGRRQARPSFRILHIKRDGLYSGIAPEAVFTPVEVDILERVARGERVIGVDLEARMAQVQLDWIANGGRYVSDDEGA